MPLILLAGRSTALRSRPGTPRRSDGSSTSAGPADDPLYSLWVFIATTGLRRGEALGLRWSDVDLDAGRARIMHTLGSIGWQVVAGQPKTAAGRRPIALDPITVDVLRDHRKRMLEQRLLVGAGFVDQDYVFCEPDGNPLHPERVYQAFKRRVRKHAFPYLVATWPSAHVGHHRARQRRPPPGRARAARARAHLGHPADVLTCAADDARRRRGAGREPSTSGALARTLQE